VAEVFGQGPDALRNVEEHARVVVPQRVAPVVLDLGTADGRQVVVRPGTWSVVARPG
jgi:hypothetical protein